MRKASTVVLLVIAVLWQAFATAQGALAYAHGEGYAHVVMHLDNEPHHHHDDGSLHQDGSDESVKHVYADGCAGTTAVPAYALPLVRGVRAEAQFSTPPSAHDSPILEGPRRPPRPTA